MGFFDGLTEALTGVDRGDVDNAGLNLGNIFLPGGIGGGVSNEQQPGRMGGTQFNETDWRWLNENWGSLRSGNGAGKKGPGQWQMDPTQLNGLSTQAQQYVKDNWSDIGRAANFTDINWKESGKIGNINYPTAPGAEGGAAQGQNSLGDLEPARSMFANIAAGAAPGGNTQANILELLRKQAAPQEQAAFNNINQNLFSRGRLGAEDSMTGEAYRGFARGQSEADLSRQLSSYGLADQLQTSQLGRQLGAAQGAGGLTSLSTLPFDMALKLAMSRSGVALDQAQAKSGTGLLDMWSQFWGGAGG